MELPALPFEEMAGVKLLFRDLMIPRFGNPD